MPVGRNGILSTLAWAALEIAAATLSTDKKTIPAAKSGGSAAIRILPWRCGGADLRPEQRTLVAGCQQGERGCSGAPPRAQLPRNAENAGERRPERLDSPR